MQTLSKIVTVYVAADGTEFTDKQQCMDYEDELFMDKDAAEIYIADNALVHWTECYDGLGGYLDATAGHVYLIKATDELIACAKSLYLDSGDETLLEKNKDNYVVMWTNYDKEYWSIEYTLQGLIDSMLCDIAFLMDVKRGKVK